MLNQHPGGLTLTKRMIEACSFSAGARVLDVGCGTGTTVEYLRKHCGIDAVGIDLSMERLGQGKKRCGELPVIYGFSERMPFIDGAFDGVIAECSLSTMEGLEKIMAEMFRLLKPGGKLAVSDLYDKHWKRSSQDCCLPTITDGQTGYTEEKNLHVLLGKNDFEIIAWEDQSAYLREFTAGYIMKYGFSEDLRPFFPCCNKLNGFEKEIRRKKLGYFMLIAEKRQERMRSFG
ncbi:MAG: Glycine/sarcosine/dimethylglycine N-methyltransferase [Firmicutes bacterium]|nr:Glycine/sarcosine/dimethylglycine N-methyltransferase [Bacillota bacterium]